MTDCFTSRQNKGCNFRAHVLPLQACSCGATACQGQLCRVLAVLMGPADQAPQRTARRTCQHQLRAAPACTCAAALQGPGPLQIIFAHKSSPPCAYACIACIWSTTGMLLSCSRDRTRLGASKPHSGPRSIIPNKPFANSTNADTSQLQHATLCL
jgi:hypothetical protein